MKKEDGGQGSAVWVSYLEEIGAPRKSEIAIQRVYGTRHDYFSKNKEITAFQEAVDNVRNLIKTEVGSETPIISGPAEIAKGKKLILGITPDQEGAFELIYGIDLDNSRVSYYASVGNTGKEGEESREVTEVKIERRDIILKSIDNLVITQALAEELGVNNGQEIKVLRVYQKTSDIDLDE